jgi:hypothetical protein
MEDLNLSERYDSRAVIILADSSRRKHWYSAASWRSPKLDRPNHIDLA